MAERMYEYDMLKRAPAGPDLRRIHVQLTDSPEDFIEITRVNGGVELRLMRQDYQVLVVQPVCGNVVRVLSAPQP